MTLAFALALRFLVSALGAFRLFVLELSLVRDSELSFSVSSVTLGLSTGLSTGLSISGCHSISVRHATSDNKEQDLTIVAKVMPAAKSSEFIVTIRQDAVIYEVN